MKRRIHILPFRQTFYAPEDGKGPIRDIGLRDKLKAELSGILAWAIRGCLAWRMVGLQPPDIVRAETAALFLSFDPLADFLDTRCVLAQKAEVETGRLWREYLDWCSGQERQPAFKAPNNFTRSLAQRDGIDSLRRYSGRYLLGIGIQA